MEEQNDKNDQNLRYYTQRYKAAIEPVSGPLSFLRSDNDD